MNNNFFFGCVESRNDELKLGRYKVRVVGIHTEDKSKLPTSDLPWATCLQPTTSAAMSGIGQNPGLVNGSWVMVVFTSDDFQVPIILGSIAGIPGRPGQETSQDGINVPPPEEATPTEKKIGVAEGVYKPEVLSTGSPYLGSLTEAQYNQLVARVRMIESSNNYSSNTNPLGYVGAYQFGAAALEDLGYIKAETWSKLRKNAIILNDKNNWTGKDGCISKDAFFALPASQDKCFLLYAQRSYKLMLKKGQVGATTDPRVLAGLIGAAHNQGTGCISSLLRGVTTKDGNGMTAQAYYDKCYAAIIVEAGQQTNTTPSTVESNPKPIPNEENLVPPKNKITANRSIGFSDPEGKYPSIYDEADTNRLVRGQNISSTIVEIKENERVKNVPIGISEKSWSQPSIQYSAQYPYNHANVSESGHVFEMDDTLNAERVHLYHRTGTFVEIDQGGNQVNKIVGHGVEIIEKDGYITVKGNCHINVNGSCTINADTLYLESPKINIKSENVKWSTKTFSLRAEEEFTVECGKTITMNATEKLHAAGKTGAFLLSGSGNTNISAKGNVNVVGTRINLNSGSIDGTSPGVYSNIVGFSGDVMNISSVSRSDIQSCQLDEHPYATVINADENAESAPTTAPAALPEPPAAPPAPISNSACPIFDLTLGDSIQLSPNYKLKDMCKDGGFNFSGQHNLTSQQILCNLSQLCLNVVEPLRVIYGKSLKINSCFRPAGSPVSKSNGPSQHELGQAVDVGFLDITSSGAARKTEYFNRANSVVTQVSYDKFLFETRGANSVWIHISYRKDNNRKQVFTFVNDVNKVSGKIVLFT